MSGSVPSKQHLALQQFLEPEAAEYFCFRVICCFARLLNALEIAWSETAICAFGEITSLG